MPIPRGSKRSLRALFALAILVGSAALPASADHGAGALFGTVTNASGYPLSGICVAAINEYAYNEVLTNEDGSYVMWEIQTGTYEVRFTDCNSPRTYATEWFDDASTPQAATAVEVMDDTNSTADAVLAVGGSITGRVTDAQGRSIPWLCVRATDPIGDWSWSSTDGNGDYVIGGLSTGTAAVLFGCRWPEYYYAGSSSAVATSSTPVAPGNAEDYVAEWYDGAATEETATPVTVTTGLATAGIDAQLVFGGSISGLVTDEHGHPLDVCVYASGDVSSADARTYSYDGGFYKIRGLPAGEYKVFFYDCYDYRYASEWYDDSPSQGRATPVTVTLGAETGYIDAALARRPIADIAVTGLAVKPVPLRTDALAIPVGTQRDVTVDLANLGTADVSSMGVYVYLQTADGRVTNLGKKIYRDVAAGDAWRETFRWDARRSIGDATIHAEVCTWSEDANARNDAATAEGYALVGGTGVGVTLQDGYWDQCTPNDYWDY